MITPDKPGLRSATRLHLGASRAAILRAGVAYAPSETLRERFERYRAVLLWAVGLIDGDGHIGLEWADRAKSKWVPLLKVSLHVSNRRAIDALARALGTGRITRSGTTVTLRVRCRRAWRELLLPLFQHYPLRTVKAFDAASVAYALSLSTCDARTILPALKHAIGRNKARGTPGPIRGLSEPTLDFSTYDPGKLAAIVDDDRLAGFAEAEGSFYVTRHGRHGFALGQAYDTSVVAGIHARLGVASRLKCRPGYVMLDTKRRSVHMRVLKTLLPGLRGRGRMHGVKGVVLRLWARSLRARNPAALRMRKPAVVG